MVLIVHTTLLARLDDRFRTLLGCPNHLRTGDGVATVLILSVTAIGFPVGFVVGVKIVIVALAINNNRSAFPWVMQRSVFWLASGVERLRTASRLQ